MINYKFDVKKYFIKVGFFLLVIVIFFIRSKNWNKFYKMFFFFLVCFVRKYCMMYY